MSDELLNALDGIAEDDWRPDKIRATSRKAAARIRALERGSKLFDERIADKERAIVSLSQQLAAALADEQDAKRYRYLRDKATVDFEVRVWNGKWKTITGSDLDVNIDQDMRWDAKEAPPSGADARSDGEGK